MYIRIRDTSGVAEIEVQLEVGFEEGLTGHDTPEDVVQAYLKIKELLAAKEEQQ